MGYYANEARKAERESNANEARKAERESNWWNAYRCWMNENGDYGRENAAACKTIAEAIDLGDRYRELVGGAHQRWENHEINNAQLYQIQCEAHEQVYGKRV